MTNIYFTHGELDPWHSNGITNALNPEAPVTILPLSAHVSDLGSIADYDSPEMKASKRKVMELVQKWLKKVEEKNLLKKEKKKKSIVVGKV
jgi:hypothetical protein